MLHWFILGLSLLAAGLFAGHWFLSADPRSLARSVKWIGIGALCLVVLYLIFTGRLAFLLPLALFLFPFLRRLRRARLSGGWRSPSAGQSSRVITEFLEMMLDHDSGEVTGKILKGQYEGSSLESLSLDQLQSLLEELRHADPESVTLLETYLDRIYPDAWRDEPGSGGESSATMTTDEAYEILGLDPTASESEIREAHHRLILKNHPDKGGSTYLAMKINQAKELLLHA